MDRLDVHGSAALKPQNGVWIKRVPILPCLFPLLLTSSVLSAEPVAVRYREGPLHGFLLLRTLEGTVIGNGDLVQVPHGDRITSRLVFRFKDGSIDDESAVYSQRGVFQLISDHHIQKGPSFPQAIDLCKALLPQMKEGGSIINTGSIQSFDPSANLIAYASTKAAIVSFTRSLASLAIKQGVRVNAVAPGPVWTPLIPSTLPKEKVKQFGSQTVFGRAAQPAEIAPIFVFLASNQASYVTGEIYGATGGQMPI